MKKSYPEIEGTFPHKYLSYLDKLFDHVIEVLSWVVGLDYIQYGNSMYPSTFEN